MCENLDNSNMIIHTMMMIIIHMHMQLCINILVKTQNCKKRIHVDASYDGSSL